MGAGGSAGERLLARLVLSRIGRDMPGFSLERRGRVKVCVPGGSRIRGTPVGSVYVAFEWDGRPENAVLLGVV